MQATEVKSYTIGFDGGCEAAAFAAKLLQEELLRRTGVTFALVASGE